MVAGGMLALLMLVGVIWRKAIRPMIRAIWRTIKRLNQVADDLLGDDAHHIPSMTARLAGLEDKLSEHLKWHSASGRENSTHQVPAVREDQS